MGSSKNPLPHSNRQELIRAVLNIDYLKEISSQDFLNLGVDLIVYIKKDEQSDRTTYNMHAADGRYLSSHENAEIAALLAMSNDMAPVTLH